MRAFLAHASMLLCASLGGLAGRPPKPFSVLVVDSLVR